MQELVNEFAGCLEMGGSQSSEFGNQLLPTFTLGLFRAVHPHGSPWIELLKPVIGWCLQALQGEWITSEDRPKWHTEELGGKSSIPVRLDAINKLLEGHLFQDEALLDLRLLLWLLLGSLTSLLLLSVSGRSTFLVFGRP